MKNSEIYKRLYKDYSKKFLDKIFISVFFLIKLHKKSSRIIPEKYALISDEIRSKASQ